MSLGGYYESFFFFFLFQISNVSKDKNKCKYSNFLHPHDDNDFLNFVLFCVLHFSVLM